MTRRFRLVLLGALYFAQGVPWGLLTVTLALHLTRAGFGPPELATLFVWATMPWTFKFLLGPFVDAFGARTARRRWMIAGAELAMAASLITLALVDVIDRRAAFLTLVFVHNLFAAFQDVATDGLAIATLPTSERGTANGVMWAAKFAGTLVGGPALSSLASARGWGMTTVVAAIITVIPATLLPFAREPASAVIPRALFRDLIAAFRPRATWWAVPFALTSSAAEAFLMPAMFPLLRGPLGLSDERINLLATTSGVTQALAALAGGWAADRFGRGRTIVAASLALGATYAAFAMLPGLWPSFSFQVVFGVATGIAAGLLYASTLALFMDLTGAAASATQFQIFMALANVPLAWAPKAGGVLAPVLSTATLFLIAAAIQLVSIVFLPRTRAPERGTMPP